MDARGSARRAGGRVRYGVVVAVVGLLGTGLATTAPAAAAPRATAGEVDVKALLRGLSPKQVGLGVPSETYDYAERITDSGWVIGTTGISRYDARVYRWKDGVAHVLWEGSSFVTQVAHDVNERGQVLVSVESEDEWPASAVLWHPDGTVERLAGSVGAFPVALNERGTAVGNARTDAGSRAVVWQDGRTVDVTGLGGADTWASGLGEQDEVAGIATDADGSAWAFLWRDGTTAALPVPDGTVGSGVWGFTDGGDVVGWVTDAGGASRAVLWHDGGAPRPYTDPCARSRQVDVAAHLPAELRDRWPAALSNVVLDGCAPRRLVTPYGGTGVLLGGNGDGIYVGHGAHPRSGWQQAVAWVHGIPVALQSSTGRYATDAAAVDVNAHGQAVGHQVYADGPFGDRPSSVIWDLVPEQLRGR